MTEELEPGEPSVGSAALLEAKLGPVAQLVIACRNPVATLLGASVGGVVPVATYATVHQEALLNDFRNPEWLLVLGGLMFSAKTVWRWLYDTFAGDWWKATGWALLVEGVLVLSRIEWLSTVALAFLVGINAIANGSKIALRHEIDRKFLALLKRKRDQEAPADGTDVTLQALVRVEEPPANSAREDPRVLLEFARADEPCPSTGSIARSRPPTGTLDDESTDALYPSAVEYVKQTGACSTSALQRHLNVGYPRAAKLVDRMQQDGLVGPPAKAGASRQVLLSPSPRAALVSVTG